MPAAVGWLTCCVYSGHCVRMCSSHPVSLARGSCQCLNRDRYSQSPIGSGWSPSRPAPTMHHVQSGSPSGRMLTPGWSGLSHRSPVRSVAITTRLGASSTSCHYESTCDAHRPPTLPDFKRRRKSITMFSSTTWISLHLSILLIFSLHFLLLTAAAKSKIRHISNFGLSKTNKKHC